VKSDTGIFTIKNYQQAKGLSFRFFSDQEQNFEVCGPYGKGLIKKEEGTHIAFAAGTGVLCFVDLVAYLALKNLLSIRENKNYGH
jgi:NAD(P)H-flavin reductase